MTIDDPAGIEALLQVLAQDTVSAAMIRHEGRATVEFDGEELPDHELTVAVHAGLGYLTYADHDHPYATAVGEPETPPYPAYYVDYPAGSGIPIQTLRQALTAFMQTARRPTMINWRAAD